MFRLRVWIIPGPLVLVTAIVVLTIMLVALGANLAEGGTRAQSEGAQATRTAVERIDAAP